MDELIFLKAERVGGTNKDNIGSWQWKKF